MTNIYGKAGGYLPHNAMAGIGIQTGFAADFDFIRLTGDIEKYSIPTKTPTFGVIRRPPA